jgi:hypothetical protein
VKERNVVGESMLLNNSQANISTDKTEKNYTYKRIGSNPISPAMDPSSLSGRTKKGIALDISSAFKETAVRWDCYKRKRKIHIC